MPIKQHQQSTIHHPYHYLIDHIKSKNIMQCKVLSSSLSCKSHNNISNINEIKMDVSPSSAAATNIKSRPILRHPPFLSSDDVIETPDMNDDELDIYHLDRKTTDCVPTNREVLDGAEDIATSPRRRTSVETKETLSLDALAQLCAMHIKQNPKEIVKFVPGSSILLPDSELQLEPTNHHRALNIPTYIESSSSNLLKDDDTLCDDLSAITNTSPEELQQIIGKIGSTRRMSFRGGSLNNVMEEEAIENSQTDIPTRGLHRSRSHEEVAREMKYTPTRRGVPRSNSGRRKRRIKPLDASIPVRRLPRKSSTKGASFKGSLKNVLEHDVVEDGNIEALKSERRRSWSGKSYRSNSQNSIRHCSTSSLSSCGSAKSQFSYGSDSSSAARSNNNISTLMDSMVSLGCTASWDGSSRNFMIDHPVLTMSLQFDSMDIPKRSGSSGSSVEDFLSWVNNGGSSCCDVSASISIRAAAINAAVDKTGCDEHDNDTVTATNKIKQSFKSRKLFKKIRRLSSGIIKPKGRARRSSWHADNEQIPQSTLAARGPPRRSITAPIDNTKDNQSEAQNYNVSPAPAGSRSRRIMNRLVKSLPTRFSFRRSSLEVDEVLDEEHNNPKVSRGFRHSIGDIAAAAESNEGSTNTA